MDHGRRIERDQARRTQIHESTDSGHGIKVVGVEHQEIAVAHPIRCGKHGVRGSPWQMLLCEVEADTARRVYDVVRADGGVIRCDDDTDIGDAAVGERGEDVIEKRAAATVGDHGLHPRARCHGLRRIERRGRLGPAHARAEAASEDDARGRSSAHAAPAPLHMRGTMRSRPPTPTTQVAVQNRAMSVRPYRNDPVANSAP